MVPELAGAGSDTDELSLVFAALAHPARRRLLALLSNGDASVAELAQPFKIGQRAVSKHLSVLERAGLITRGKDAQKRPSHLHTEALRSAHQWLETYRVLWESRFDRLEDLLAAPERGGKGRAKKRRPRR